MVVVACLTVVLCSSDNLLEVSVCLCILWSLNTSFCFSNEREERSGDTALSLSPPQELHLGLGPHEEELYEEHSGITDAGLGHLAAIKSLRVLSLEGREGVTDAGVAPLILALPNLTALDARRTQVLPPSTPAQ
jgi:hypothetical protein